jgi:5,10-methylenetetrahydromethanopterin reductase
MRIGLSPPIPGSGSVDDVVASARQAADDGFSTYWMAQVFGLDALTALTVVGREVSGIELGTAVVPTYPRHPWVMAQQAATAQAATGNRLALGIGLSHKIVIEGMWGLSFAKPVAHLREYLEVLVPLSKGETVDYEGATVTARGTLEVPGAAPFPILVAALGTQMLEVTGRLADGTITWCVGPKTLAGHTIPTISAAAAHADRAIPRVVAMFPVGVTADPDGTRERLRRGLSIYGTLPSYRAMLDREGAGGAADLAILGGEQEVADQIAHLKQIGVTDLGAVPVSTRNVEEATQTRELLRRLQAELG